jgi:TRAP transporter 4TM/12TM fusion protein
MVHRAGGEPGAQPATKAGQFVGPDAEPSSVSEALLAEYEAEKPARKLTGIPKLIVQAAGVALSLYALYWVFNPLPPQQYRITFLAVALPMTFLVYRMRVRKREAETQDHPSVIDWLLVAASVAALVYPLLDYDSFSRRAVSPTTADIVFGMLVVLLVLEACRRTVGWILPAVCLAFLAYAYYGNLIPVGYSLGHVGYDFDRLAGHMFMGLEGIFGIPLDVAATYIVLFTIYGAVLEFSGAARYFLDVSFAAFGKSAAAPGRTVALAGFLLGTVSGSGVATTVTLGSVSWPILKQAGYPPNQGAGVLAASGIGAILSPPTLGAAAFIIAEFLDISYLEVLLFATVPTVLYYLGIILAIEADARRFRARGVLVDTPPLGYLVLRYGYHFSSLVLIVVFMAFGLSPFRAVVYSTGIAFLLSFLSKESRFTPRKLWEALVAGAMGMLPVAATCAAAGIIVGVTTLTGLGLKLSGIIVDLAGSKLFLTALYSAIAVLVLGLAVPVTASFIIGAVIIGPALTALGVEPFAAYMFIFYYAVLSEVSPPTALSAVAASAITGGNAFRSMMLTWRYTLPAFLVPFAFVLSPNGEGLLLEGDLAWMVLALVFSAVAVAALAVTTGGWLFGPARWPERALCGIGGLVLLYLEPRSVAVGLGFIALGLAFHLATRNRGPQPAAAEALTRTAGDRTSGEPAPAGSATSPEQQAPKAKDPGAKEENPGAKEEEAV